MSGQDNRILAAYLAEQAARPELRECIAFELVRFAAPALGDQFTRPRAQEYAARLARSGEVSVLPEEIAAVIHRAEIRRATPFSRVCEVCLELGIDPPRRAPADKSTGELYEAHWAVWEPASPAFNMLLCPQCWARYRYAELERLLGPPKKIWQEGPTLANPVYLPRVESHVQRDQHFDSLPEFIAAVETHPTRIPSTSPETQEDAIQPRDRDWTAPAGQPTTEEIARRYADTEIVRELGKGVTSVVYEVVRPSTGKRYALKVLKVGLARSPGMQARFRREAEALVRLNHPNVVRLIEFKNLTNMMCFLVELVDGVTLDEVISQGGALQTKRALEITEAICDGLGHAHRLKIVHRDIKAENIFIRHDGQVKIGDFGLAKLTESMHGARPLTAQDGLMGTPIYMAPEQRASPHDVDGRADIYSLGVLLHEMLTGRLPPEPAPGEAARLDPVHPGLDRILATATALDPDDRYPIAEDFKRALMAARLGL